jgi:hypothetical protein
MKKQQHFVEYIYVKVIHTCHFYIFYRFIADVSKFTHPLT